MLNKGTFVGYRGGVRPVALLLDPRLFRRERGIFVSACISVENSEVFQVFVYWQPVISGIGKLKIYKT